MTELTQEQIQTAKERMIEDLASAIQRVVLNDWTLLENRLKDVENVRKQLQEAKA